MAIMCFQECIPDVRVVVFEIIREFFCSMFFLELKDSGARQEVSIWVRMGMKDMRMAFFS